MGVLFSAVKLTAGEKQSEFLVAGIPKEYGDLEGWTRFEEFMDELDEECTVKVHADAYLYRRCTWTIKGEKRYVWRCINRLDYGKKYCHESPTVEETTLHEAIMRAIQKTAQMNIDVLKTLKLHIGMALNGEESVDKTFEIQVRIAEIDAEFSAMLETISSDTVGEFDENKVRELMDEKSELQRQLADITETKQQRETTESRLDEIFTVIEGLKNRPMEYDDQVVRQIIECIVVESKDRIKVIFIGGLEVTEELLTE